MSKAIVNVYTVNRPTWEGVKLAPGRWQVNLFIYETYDEVQAAGASLFEMAKLMYEESK